MTQELTRSAPGVKPLPLLTSATSAALTVGSAFSFQLTALWYPSLFEVTIIPDGLEVNQLTGLITGTPTAVGVSRCNVRTTNWVGTSDTTMTFTSTLANIPVITSYTGAWGMFVGEAMYYQITASYFPTSYNATDLPDGLSIDTETGIISGTLASEESGTITISATNALGTGTATIDYTVGLPLSAMTNDSVVQGYAGWAFNLDLTATNDPTDWSTDDPLDWGVSLIGSGGAKGLNGTPTYGGTHEMTITITNANGTSQYALTINVCGPPAP
jgi:hypothetical protein